MYGDVSLKAIKETKLESYYPRLGKLSKVLNQSFVLKSSKIRKIVRRLKQTNIQRVTLDELKINAFIFIDRPCFNHILLR